MTLSALLVGVGVGSLVLMSMMMVFVSSNRAFVSMGNYVNLDQSSRMAVEKMTRDMRNSQNLTSFSTNQLIFTYSGATNLTYSYNAAARTLTYWKTGGPTNTLLTGCDSLLFAMYNSVPQPGGTFSNAASVSQAKVIGTSWKCSRKILGKKANTESTQEALIVIRNKPVQ